MADEPRAGAVLYAKNLDRVAAFYSAIPGFRAADRDNEHVRIESSAFQLVVLQMPEHAASGIAIADPPARRSDAAIKLVLFVPSIAAVRASAPSLGAALNGVDGEWSFNGWRVCDGLDPEGNVIQFRERAAAGAAPSTRA